MKKLLIILFVAASAIAGAATLHTSNKVEEIKIQTAVSEVKATKSQVLATWD